MLKKISDLVNELVQVTMQLRGDVRNIATIIHSTVLILF